MFLDSDHPSNQMSVNKALNLEAMLRIYLFYQLHNKLRHIRERNFDLLWKNNDGHQRLLNMGMAEKGLCFRKDDTSNRMDAGLQGATLEARRAVTWLQKRKDKQRLLQQEEKGRNFCSITWEVELRGDSEGEMKAYVYGLSNFLDSRGIKGNEGLRNSCWRLWVWSAFDESFW